MSGKNNDVEKFITHQINETQFLYNGKSLVEDNSFALKILSYMHNLKVQATYTYKNQHWVK